MKHFFAKLTAQATSKKIAFLLISVLLVVSAFSANSSLSKYVLEPIQQIVSITSSKVFGTILVTDISPIIGTTAAGKTLTAGTITPADATVTYQWKKSQTKNGSYADIPGATSDTYVLVIDDNNHFIKVSVTGTGDYNGTATSVFTGPVIDTATPLTSMGAITGDEYLGQTLTAGALYPAGATATYQWQRASTVNGTYINIPGAVNESYILTEEDVDYFIKVVATGSGIYSGTVSANTGPIRTDKITLTDIGSISGTTVIGNTLTAGAITPNDATVVYQWLISDSANGTYTAIENASSPNFLLTTSTSGKYIKVSATGTGVYYQTVTSNYTGPVSTLTTDITGMGDITGEVQVGQTLTAGGLTPVNATATYQWQKSSTVNGPYQIIPGATASTYTLTANDYNQYIRIEATGSGTYSGQVTKTTIATVSAAPLTSIGDISGTNSVGQQLTAGTVKSAGTPVTSQINYQWQRAADSGGAYTNISGATASTYTLQSTDRNGYLRVVVTGTGPYTGTVTSNFTGPIITAGSATALTSIGQITGTTHVTGTLTAGTLTPYGATATYQWQRSLTKDDIDFANIPGATGKTYALTGSDKGNYIRVVATGSGVYQNTVKSLPSDLITACPITSIADISGTAKPGEILTAGVLTPLNATATYQWKKSSVVDGPYINISGATSSSYELSEDDIGSYLKVEAKGKDSYIGTVTSNYTGPVAATSTEIESIGAITGTAQVEQTLTAGALTPAVATGTYQWQRGTTAAGDYIDIPGATGNEYKLTPSDYDKFIRVVVKGSGIYSGTKISDPVGKVAPCPITSIAPINGVANAGNTLTAGEILPLGANATATYQWMISQRTHKGPEDGYNNISGATASTYLLTTANIDYYIKLVATGTGAYSGSVTSYYIGPVRAANQGIPLTSIKDIIGTTQVGGKLTAGALLPAGGTATYQWQRSSTPNGTYNNIPGANLNTYTTTSSDRNSYIKVVASGSGDYTGEVTSKWAGPINLIPIDGLGAIQGTTVIGETLTAGATTPYGATVSYRWQRATAAEGSYTDISGATMSSYKLTSEDDNHYLRVVATGTGDYLGTKISPVTGPVVASATPITSIGDITGTTQVEQILTAGSVNPEGATVTYQWQKATSAGGNYLPISGATTKTYKLTASDYNHSIRVVATGSGTYSGSVTSNNTNLVGACPISDLSPIEGTGYVGFVLTAGKVTPPEAIVSYQWQFSTNNNQSNYRDIDGATFSTYIVVESSPQAKWVRLKVTGINGYSNTLYSDGVSIKTSGDDIPITAIGLIQGTTQAGNTLTAGDLTPSGATATYQWQRSSTIDGTYANIVGATSSSYQIKNADEGDYIRLVATGSGNYSGTIISEATGPIYTTRTPITGIADIIGTAASGYNLTAGVLTPPHATVTYQWYRSDDPNGTYDPISGATAIGYTLGPDDVGKHIRLVATATGAYTGVATSNPTAQVVATATEITGLGDITGTVQVGETLTVGAITPNGATVTYQWQIFTETDGIYVDIAGANGSSYTLREDEYNYYIRLIVTGIGSYSGTLEAQTDVKVAKMETTTLDSIDSLELEGPEFETTEMIIKDP